MPSAQAALPGLTIALLGSALILGGGQDWLGDTLIQLLALPVIALAVIALRRRTWTGPETVGVALTCALIVLPLIQLLPLPPEIWSSLPGRAQFAAELGAAGMPPGWRPMTLSPTHTEQALWSLLPGVAMFLAGRALPVRVRMRLVWILLGAGVAGLVLGLAQLAGGPESALRWYRYTNPFDAVGFFANRNHFAASLAISIPLALAALIDLLARLRDGRAISRSLIVLLALATVALIVALVISRSRAGIVVGMLGLLGCVPLVLRSPIRIHATRILAVVTVAGVMLAIQFGLYAVLSRLHRDPLDDIRWIIHQTTREAAAVYAPLGSGYGTFVQTYQAHEAPDYLIPRYINHAHGDYHELWLEGGWPAAALIVAVMVWLLWIGWRAWRLPAYTLPGGLAQAATLAIGVVLLHSMVDYPLRTTALSTAFGLLVAIIAGAADKEQSAGV